MTRTIGCLLALSAPLAAADPLITLSRFHAANQARSELARESAAWISERQRLEALIAATEAETARLEHQATAAEAERDAAVARVAAMGQGSDLKALRSSLSDGGARLAVGLAELARRLPPGAVPASTSTGGEAGFESAVRALESAERAASAIAVEVITGQREGRTEAVRILRVAGSVAWWMSLDGLAAGTVRVVDGVCHLTPAADEASRLAIALALAEAEGRSPPTVVLLPGVAP